MTGLSAHDLSPGARFGRYRVEAHVASGGMGVVYRATDLELERPVALKLIAPEWAGDETLRERFKHESRLVAGLEHPNVIPVYEAGERDGVLFIAMRFVAGTDLRGLIAERGALDPGLVARIASRVASALDAAHAAGLVHRDVKPGNVLLSGGPGDEHPYLTDFGLAKQLTSDADLTRSGQWVGTIDYVAPEQLVGDAVDARTDVYSLAVLVFVALSGEVPYPGKSDPAKMTAKLHETPPPITRFAPALPAALDAVLRRGMAREPGERFQSAGDLARALRAALEQGAAQGEPAPPPTRPSAPVPETSGWAAPSPSAPVPEGSLRAAPVSVGTGAAPARTLRPRVAAAAAAGVAAVVAAVLLLAGVFDGGDSATAGRSTSTPRPSSPTSPTSPTSPGGAVSAAAAEDVVGAFEKAFKDENAAALASTLAQDVVFESTAPVVGTTSHSGRTEVTSNFEQQFPLTESYTFTREATRTSDSATIVSGRFTQDIGATLVSGSVRFSVADVDGKPLIVRIASTVSG